MLVACIMANFFGVLVMDRLLMRGAWGRVAPDLSDIFGQSHLWYAFFALLVVLVVTRMYERPVRRMAQAIFEGREIPPETAVAARRRLLNEPFFVIFVSLAVWMAAGLFLGWLVWSNGWRGRAVMAPILGSLNSGLIISTLVFFLSEHIVQQHMSPYFFPEGGLSRTPGVIRVRIIVRLAALLFACNIVPCIASILLLNAPPEMVPGLSGLSEQLRWTMTSNFLVFMAVGVLAAVFVNMNLSLPFWDVVEVLRGISAGHFDLRVRVVSNDELGYTGDIINEMADGLEEGERLRHSLALAREVQQSFLPSGPPAVRGLDVAGRSVYCDETGGDYYDYLIPSEPGSGRVGLVVGDVSDHGLQSALLMILARTSIRHHAFHSADLAEIASDVNVHLAEDFGESGHFMTLFLASVDTDSGELTWINAGHDPALLYDPAGGEGGVFMELGGRHPALGVSAEAVFRVSRGEIHRGQVLVIGTDGIWETENEVGECFGKERLKAAVRRASPGTADEILSAVFADLESFGGRLARRDDVTLVVAKAVGDK